MLRAEEERLRIGWWSRGGGAPRAALDAEGEAVAEGELEPELVEKRPGRREASFTDQRQVIEGSKTVVE